MHKYILIHILIISFLYTASCIKVDTKRSLLIDEYGRYRVFHGVNVVYKKPPFYPPITKGFDPMNSFSEVKHN